ncbi:DUF917 domain-containing protein [Alteromonas aestuariivivens]|uniref:DUF917 domain-containing protein n=1 Tax=Alteromonas aestuariivivens TaxID=1938339 RepID=A0A3D8MAH0_9ALTE|nr:DUF917 domain-containing protein [Alteromonas aestuariivivens]RDV26814.1 DUF917 domain-containing protein [Alteromonas aestuariivivens]
MNKIYEHQLEDLSLGSVFLATGGGGDPYLPMLLTRQVLKEFGPVTLIKVDDIDDNAHVVPVGAVGAPTVSLELLPSIEEASATLAAYEQATGNQVDVVASFEVGGGNSLLPIMAAAAKGVPVIDGDGMGRALPEAQMMTYAIAGAKPTPAVARDYAGNTARFDTADTSTYERHIRSFAMAAGGMITAAEHPMTGAFIKKAIIPGTLSFAIRLGETLRKHRGNAENLLPHLQDTFANSVYGTCRLLYTGKVTDKATSIIGGYDVGSVTINAFDHQQVAMQIAIKNEYLIARIGDEVVATVPDLIVLCDYETGTPINAERLKYGQRVAVFAVGCPQFYRSEAALKAVSPRAFGFDLDYLPLQA